MKPVTYSKDVREEAKRLGCGMLTVSIVFPDGSRIDEQRACASLAEPQLVKWALAAVACEELRGLVDLEALVRGLSQGENKATTASTTSPGAG
jgi:hypothetical protein